MKTVKASLLTKIVILILIVYLSITLLNLRSDVRAAKAELTALQSKVSAQAAENAALEEDIEHGHDPETILEIAKEKLGLVESGEVVFYDTNN